MTIILPNVGILPVHPRTGLTAIGIGRRGPIWPVIGGAEPAADDAGDGDDADSDDDDADDDSGDGEAAAEAWKPPTQEEWEAAQARLARANAQGKRLRERLTAAQQGQPATAAAGATAQPPAPAKKAAKAGGKRADREDAPEPTVQVVDNSAEIAEWQNRAIRSDAKAALLSRGCDPDLIDAPLSRLKVGEIDWDGDDPDLDDYLDDMQERYPKLFAKQETAAAAPAKAARRPGSIDQGASTTGRPAPKRKKFGEALIEASGTRIDADGHLVAARRRV